MFVVARCRRVELRQEFNVLIDHQSCFAPNERKPVRTLCMVVRL